MSCPPRWSAPRPAVVRTRGRHRPWIRESERNPRPAARRQGRERSSGTGGWWKLSGASVIRLHAQLSAINLIDALGVFLRACRWSGREGGLFSVDPGDLDFHPLEGQWPCYGVHPWFALLVINQGGVVDGEIAYGAGHLASDELHSSCGLIVELHRRRRRWVSRLHCRGMVVVSARGLHLATPDHDYRDDGEHSCQRASPPTWLVGAGVRQAPHGSSSSVRAGLGAKWR